MYVPHSNLIICVVGPTLKLKRHVVVSKYKETIDQFYA